jgi:hypothetical protein
MLKCKFEHCQYPNCDGENCGLSTEELLAMMCIENSAWRARLEEMYFKAMTTPVQTLQRELRALLPEEEITCPFGFTDCVYDPAYIRRTHLAWWKKLGRPTECSCHYSQEEADNMGWCPHYDDEDK